MILRVRSSWFNVVTSVNCGVKSLNCNNTFMWSFIRIAEHGENSDNKSPLPRKYGLLNMSLQISFGKSPRIIVPPHPTPPQPPHVLPYYSTYGNSKLNTVRTTSLFLSYWEHADSVCKEVPLVFHSSTWCPHSSGCNLFTRKISISQTQHPFQM